MRRSKALTKNEAIKSVRITSERHRTLSQAALDSDATIIEITDKVIAAGIKAMVLNRRAKPCPN